MRILEVEIENFKGIKYLKINTNADIVVIEGANGSGKTRILDAIYLCLLGRCRNCLGFEDFDDGDTRIVVTLLRAEKKYCLELVIKRTGVEKCWHFYMHEEQGCTEYKKYDYLNFVRNYIFKNYFYEQNFINCDYYSMSRKYRAYVSLVSARGKRVIEKALGLIVDINKLNEVAEDLGFPIEGRNLVFKDGLDCDIYEDDKIFMGGFYSAGDNMLRMIARDLIIIKYLEKEHGERSPILIDDGFSMIDMQYVMNLCEYFKKFDNQLFLTNNKFTSLDFNNSKSVIKVDLDKLSIS